VKWLNSTPTIGVCEYCSQEFKVPLPALTKPLTLRPTFKSNSKGTNANGKIADKIPIGSLDAS